MAVMSRLPVTWYTPATDSRNTNVPSRFTVVKTSAAPSSRRVPPYVASTYEAVIASSKNT